MQIHQIKSGRTKSKRRVGRGGKKGTYSGRGMKGQKSRSGSSVNPIFEGGRSTLVEHLPKMRGFKSLKAKNQIISLGQIEKNFETGDTVNPHALLSKKLIDNIKIEVKILSDGEISKEITVEKCRVSKSAKSKIEAAGGKIVAGS